MKLSASSRLHFGLINLSQGTLRAFGGMGLSINQPRTTLVARKAKFHSLIGFDCQDAATLTMLKSILTRLERDYGELSFELELLEAPPQHCGFGSKTALYLASLCLINRFANFGMGQEEIIYRTGRGGASGIGVHGFFGGGVIVDGGQYWNRQGPILTSEFSRPQRHPPMHCRVALPDRWQALLFMPNDGIIYSNEAEREFVLANPPIPRLEALEALSAVYQLCLPALIERDHDTFKHGLRKLNSVGFKGRELDNQSPDVKELIEVLNSLGGVAAGLSSMGPLVFAVTNLDEYDQEAVGKLVSTARYGFIMRTAMDRTGHEWPE